MEKKQIRKKIREQRAHLTQEEIEARSRQICRRILDMEAFQKASCLYTYIDCKGEASTRLLMEEAWKLGKRVAAPKVHGEDMDYFYIRSMEDLEPGYFQIPEPKEGLAKAEEEDALVIVPGVAFDSHLHRCGYGKGFYDRYLKAHPHHTAIAIALEFQVVEEVPSEQFDVCPDMLVTPLRTIRNRMDTLEEMGVQAQAAKPILQKLGTDKKNNVLKAAARKLTENSSRILLANEKDVETARKNGMNPGLIDRLTLTKERIFGMADGLTQLAALEDPIGEVLSMKKRPNGLLIGQKRVPIGVVGMIYEARPNVTADAFGLCFKTGNAVILKGGSDALHSNEAIVSLIQETLLENGLPVECVQLISSMNRAVTTAFMKLNQYVDVLIPRGSARLIQAVVENSTIPVIETGTGNCHIYVDESADLDMAVNIIFNAKTQRIGVCNACESLVVHENVVNRLMPLLKKKLDEKQVELRGDEKARQAVEGVVPVTEEDWGKEYLDYILSIRTVSSLDEAIDHINRYNTGHSEAIITENYTNAQRFLEEIDAAAVYVNASTRFTDGSEFGFGAEIGISTQKLHARGPMGLLALTTTKYIVYGNGQVRA